MKRSIQQIDLGKGECSIGGKGMRCTKSNSNVLSFFMRSSTFVLFRLRLLRS